MDITELPPLKPTSPTAVEKPPAIVELEKARALSEKGRFSTAIPTRAAAAIERLHRKADTKELRSSLEDHRQDLAKQRRSLIDVIELTKEMLIWYDKAKRAGVLPKLPDDPETPADG